MRWLVLAPIASLLAGVGLVLVSVLRGGASVAIVVVVPVISGSSGTFLLGIALLIAGLLSLPLALAYDREENSSLEDSGGSARPRPEGAGGSGGFVLVGPVPIVFGSWKGISPRTRRLLALAGAILLIAAVVATVLIVG